ncbi:MAG: molybdate ABC transporter substrate-binding protein [Methanolinea sp.]|nr:molybdate ABC transporter substrate-binding protein [Methanolinea sp.]
MRQRSDKIYQSRTTVVCILLLLLVGSVSFAGCTSSSQPTQGGAVTSPTLTQAQSRTPLVIYAAASLTGASPVLKQAFETANPKYEVTFDLDGTQMLTQKIEQGAKADVFLSASTKYTDRLKSGGYLDNSTVKKFASNYIIIILPASNPAKIESAADLSRDDIRIAMGTEEVPVGINTRQAIERMANASYGQSWKDGVFSNVVTFETTEPGVVTKVNLGEVDAGFVYESSYKAAKAGQLKGIVIPKDQNSLQTYTVGILNGSGEVAGASKFVEFLTTAEGQEILADFGFASA